MKKIYLLCLLVLIVAGAKAQLSIQNGKHVLEVSGSLATYYNQRFLKSSQDDQKNDRFKLKDARLKLEGRVEKTWDYQLQVDFADFANGDIDAENPGIMDAYVTYRGLSFMNVKLGYSKVPYSFSSLVPFKYTAFWKRSQIADGELFNRRDVGVTLSRNFLRSLLRVYAGAYTGLGEVSLKGDNDASGNLEYAGRAEFSYPVRTKYREIDYDCSPIPVFAVAINGRYADKTLPDGDDLPANAGGEYGLNVINGKKYTYGMDASFLYHGLSAQFEIDQVKGEPYSDSDALYQGFSKEQANGHFYSGGYYAQLNYFEKNWKTTFSVRYEQMNISDLSNGKSERMSAGINYQVDGLGAMLKIQYFGILKDESIDKQKWKNQLRVGMVFNL